MRAHTALATASAKINTATILPGGSHYPPQPAPAPRSGQWVWRSVEFTITTDFQEWLVRPSLYLIAPKLNESTYDIAAVDPLVTAVVDLFVATNPDAHKLEIPGDHAQHCFPTAGGVEAFSGWYAFRLDFEIKLHRAAGSA